MVAPLQLIDDEKTVKALVDPMRLSIVQELARRPRTLTQLARSLHRTPATMHHHIRVLEEVQVVRVVSTKTVNNNFVEKYYGITTPASCIVGFSLLGPKRGPVPPRGHRPPRAMVAVDQAALGATLREIGFNPDAFPAEAASGILATVAETARDILLETLVAQRINLPAATLERIAAMAAGIPVATLARLVENPETRQRIRALVSGLGPGRADHAISNQEREEERKTEGEGPT